MITGSSTSGRYSRFCEKIGNYKRRLEIGGLQTGKVLHLFGSTIADFSQITIPLFQIVNTLIIDGEIEVVISKGIGKDSRFPAVRFLLFSPN